MALIYESKRITLWLAVIGSRLVFDSFTTVKPMVEPAIIFIITYAKLWMLKRCIISCKTIIEE